MVEKMVSALGYTGVRDLEMIDNGDLIIAANAYFEELAKHADLMAHY